MKTQINLSHVVNALADGRYRGEKFAEAAKEILGCTVEIAKRNQLHTFAVIPKRSVVEMSFARLEKCRRLWKICERKIEYKFTNGCLGFCSFVIKKILNMILV